jgi:2Fe-2S ferredoxin
LADREAEEENVPKITYEQPDGTRAELEVEEGTSVMRGAVDNGIDGIVAECGGACACATCQVVIGAEWRDKLPAPGVLEEAMLEDVEGDDRRLSCQIEVTAELDGMIVKIPATQY